MEVGHSGASMGWTMRNIEFIAKNGLPAHREMFLENRRRCRDEEEAEEAEEAEEEKKEDEKDEDKKDEEKKEDDK